MADLTLNDLALASGAWDFRPKNATSYHFENGLSRDSRLPEYLQDLRVNQLQIALDGESPNQDLIDLLREDINGTGSGWFPDGASSLGEGVPSWVWLVGVGALVAIAVKGLGR